MQLNKKILKNLAIYLAGFATAAALLVILGLGPEARAGQYSCIRNDLDAQGMTGNIPDPDFTITYNVPGCYKHNGYSVQRVYMHGDRVAVHYVQTGG